MNKKNEKLDKKTEEKKPLVAKKESSFKKKKKIKRNITSGIAFVYSTFNNTINPCS
jgi:small subunit ribosomal protein S11